MNFGQVIAVKELAVLNYEVLKKLDVEQVVLDYHIFYLAEKGLIIIKTPPNSSWSNAKITATGMDHVDAHT